MPDVFTIETLFKEYGFTPNESQKEAIMTLLWRKVNLIFFHNILRNND